MFYMDNFVEKNLFMEAFQYSSWLTLSFWLIFPIWYLFGPPDIWNIKNLLDAIKPWALAVL